MPSNVSASRDKQSWDYALRSGLAGGVAGCVAKTAIAPLDRVKILFQTSNPDFQKYTGSWSGAFKAASRIYTEAGVRGLLQGHSATLLRVFPYASIKFMAYDKVHYMLMPTREQETNLRRFAAGSLSGMISVLFTYPLEVIRVRMAFQTRSSSPSPLRPSFIRAIQQISSEGASRPSASRTTKTLFDTFPVLKFYRGFTVTIIGMVPYAGTSFLTWGFLRARYIPRPKPGEKKPATPLADLTIGGISGMIAQTVSYPFEIIRRRMQVGGLTRPDRWMRWGETVKAIYNTGGWRGFYVGLSIGYLKVVPMTAISYAVWQAGKRVLKV
ncbi:mitochondrial carrier [Gloeophyllum trabeum ATCC 11539]|uniref:Mitochondrial carrier n=1 Tax=Gloeophyllum trabeum (strain ATCC 11539 / FP-39264 / Madison 617) TaxID=670483 RepID=S7RFK4_GLOTA|nr:mitochondrial carrier [Gloeophyllum trabeum ATCC 11539]EPQ52965.1 mitochondrial carrier [Gloeophyllum trabeum ATCC 11539]